MGAPIGGLPAFELTAAAFAFHPPAGSGKVSAPCRFVPKGWRRGWIYFDLDANIR
jgi:hypothetical protein